VIRSQLAEQRLAQGSAYEKLKETSKNVNSADTPSLIEEEEEDGGDEI